MAYIDFKVALGKKSLKGERGGGTEKKTLSPIHVYLLDILITVTYYVIYEVFKL